MRVFYSRDEDLLITGMISDSSLELDHQGWYLAVGNDRWYLIGDL